METIRIREIQKHDNAQMASIVREVLTDFGAPKVGTAYADPYLDTLFEVYNIPRAVYFVVENEGKILGGAGIMQLENAEDSICELQKMYFLPEIRGLGFGTQLMDLCLEKARAFGFESCYIETMTSMDAALKLYRKSGFDYLEQPVGNTGHNSCELWMLKKLK